MAEPCRQFASAVGEQLSIHEHARRALLVHRGQNVGLRRECVHLVDLHVAYLVVNGVRLPAQAVEYALRVVMRHSDAAQGRAEIRNSARRRVRAPRCRRRRTGSPAPLDRSLPPRRASRRRAIGTSPRRRPEASPALPACAPCAAASAAPRCSFCRASVHGRPRLYRRNPPSGGFDRRAGPLCRRCGRSVALCRACIPLTWRRRAPNPSARRSPVRSRTKRRPRAGPNR